MPRYDHASEVLNSLASVTFPNVPVPYQQPSLPAIYQGPVYPTLSFHLEDVRVKGRFSEVVNTAIRVARERNVNVVLELDGCTFNTSKEYPLLDKPLDRQSAIDRALDYIYLKTK